MATAAKQAARQGGIATSISTVKGWPERFRNYVDGLKREMRLVTWPSQKQVQATTIVVMVTVFCFGLFFGIVDFVLTWAQTGLYGAFE
jgi:preprotein translocase subunit SecE